MTGRAPGLAGPTLVGSQLVTTDTMAPWLPPRGPSAGTEINHPSKQKYHSRRSPKWPLPSVISEAGSSVESHRLAERRAQTLSDDAPARSLPLSRAGQALFASGKGQRGEGCHEVIPN